MDMPNRVELSGEYDLSRREEVRNLFDQVKAGPLVVEVSRVTYCDSLILQELVRLKQRLADVTLAAPSPGLMRLLKITSLDTFFRIVER